MTSQKKISFRAKMASGEKPLLAYFEKEEKEEEENDEQRTEEEI
jgi:hypothetical protein